MEHHKTLEGQVLYILKTVIESRDSDEILIKGVWHVFHYGYIRYIFDKGTGEHESMIPLDNIFKLPHIPSIVRYRRMIQARGVCVPLKFKTVIARHMKVDEWEKALGYRWNKPEVQV